MVKPLPLIVHKEEQLVFLDRSAESSAVHVPTERVARNLRSWINFVFPLVGVELVVPEKFPYIAVKGVGAGFEGCADDATHKVAELMMVSICVASVFRMGAPAVTSTVSVTCPTFNSTSTRAI